MIPFQIQVYTLTAYFFHLVGNVQNNSCLVKIWIPQMFNWLKRQCAETNVRRLKPTECNTKTNWTKATDTQRLTYYPMHTRVIIYQQRFYNPKTRALQGSAFWHSVYTRLIIGQQLLHNQKLVLYRGPNFYILYLTQNPLLYWVCILIPPTITITTTSDDAFKFLFSGLYE